MLALLVGASAGLLGGCAERAPERELPRGTGDPLPAVDPTAERIAGATITGGGREITVSQGADGCTTLTLDVAESPTDVRLRLGVVPGSGPCGQALTVTSASATLAEPLGERAVVDVATGAPVPAFDDTDEVTLTHLPRGYALVARQLDVHGTSPAWVRTYDRPNGRSATIRVTQAASPVTLVDVPATGALRIGRQRVAVHRAAGRLALTWTAPGGVRLAVDATAVAPRVLPPLAGLRAIAAGVRLP